MIIKKRRIRKLERHLPENLQGQELRLGIIASPELMERIQKAGFPTLLTEGDRLLPSIVGPVTRFNAEGKNKVRRDQAMETAYRQVEWHWTEYHGKEKIEKSDIKDIPYQRYPREFIPPPSIELQVAQDAQGRMVVTTDPIRFDDALHELLLHAINVVLELFGQCETFTATHETISIEVTRQLNWEILPPGEYPWERLQQAVRPIVDRAKKGHQGAIWARLKEVDRYHPEFVATGRAGFHGYMIFGFPSRSLFVLESAYYGNATYVFDRDWETLSRLTKAEILAGNLQTDRLIHVCGWDVELGRLFGRFPKF